MRRHKQHYLAPTDNPNIYQMVLVWRKPKHKSKIRRITWWAWHYKFK